MTEDEWARVEAATLIAWEDLPTPAVLRGWREWLDEYPAVVVVGAIQKLAEDGLEYRPKVGVIVKECKIATLSDQPTFGDLLEQARGFAQGARWESAPGDFEWDPPAFADIMRQVGWSEFMNSDPDDRAPLLARMRRIFDDAMAGGKLEPLALAAPDDTPEYQLTAEDWKNLGERLKAEGLDSDEIGKLGPSPEGYTSDEDVAI